MIYGVGTDICSIARIAGAVSRRGDAFARRILCQEELGEYARRCTKDKTRGMRFLATRFAAKEAFSKAMGFGFRPPMAWHAVCLQPSLNGCPTLITKGALEMFMQEQALTAHVSITDEVAYAVAFVVVERLTTC